MRKGEYEVGFCKPPKAHQFQKGQSGNSEGRKQKPPPTIARMIDEALLEPLPVTSGGIQRQATGLELITMSLLVGVSTGNKKAHSVLRKYEAYAKTRPRIKLSDMSASEGAEAYGRYLQTGIYEQKRLKKTKAKLSIEENKRQKLLTRMARMRAGLERPGVLDGMTEKEAGEMWTLFLKWSIEPNRPRFRPRKGKLAASEIFDQVLNSPVTINKNGELMIAPRVKMAITRLFASAVRGDIKSADMLIIMHAESLRYGDFFSEVRYIKR